MIDSGTAFVLAVMIVATFAYLAHQTHVRGEVMKEALRNGLNSVEID